MQKQEQEVLPALLPIKQPIDITISELMLNKTTEESQEGSYRIHQRPTSIIHSIYTDQRFIDNDGGNKMVIHVPVVARDGRSEANPGLLRRRNDFARDNRKVAFLNVVTAIPDTGGSGGFGADVDEYSTRDEWGHHQ